jgi:hypothetical protein
MKKYLFKHLRVLVPPKALRKQKFMRHSKRKIQQSRQYGYFRYQNLPKSNRFNRWQDYKRLINKFN